MHLLDFFYFGITREFVQKIEKVVPMLYFYDWYDTDISADTTISPIPPCYKW